MSQPQNWCVWHIETSGASPQVGLQHTHRPFFVDDGEAPAKYSLFKWSIPALSSLHVITDVQMYGLIKPHEWKCTILRQFHEGDVIHIWPFRYDQERRQWE